MKTSISVILTSIIIVTLFGCNVPKEQYTTVTKPMTQDEKTIDSLQQKINFIETTSAHDTSNSNSLFLTFNVGDNEKTILNKKLKLIADKKITLEPYMKSEYYDFILNNDLKIKGYLSTSVKNKVLEYVSLECYPYVNTTTGKMMNGLIDLYEKKYGSCDKYVVYTFYTWIRKNVIIHILNVDNHIYIEYWDKNAEINKLNDEIIKAKKKFAKRDSINSINKKDI